MQPPETSAEPAIDVFVLAAARFYEEGLARMLSSDCRFRVAGTASTVQDAVLRIAGRSSSPDVALIDVPPPSGFDSARRLRAAAPSMRLIALSVSDREQDVLGWAAAGVSGFVTLGTPLDGLMEAVDVVAREGSLCSPTIAATLLRRVEFLGSGEPPNSGHGTLTPREQDILALIERGLPNKLIALELRLSLATVKNHVHSILEKLQVTRRGEAAAAARQRRTAGHPGQSTRVDGRLGDVRGAPED